MRALQTSAWALAAAGVAAMAVAMVFPGASAAWAQAAAVQVQAVRVPAAGPVPVRPGKAARGIFVPQPKGAGETLDDTGSTGGPAEKTDVVTTTLGDRLLGNVLGMDAGGKLRLSGPQFEGEVQVSMATIDGVALRGGDKESGRDEVVLTNGDRIVGELVQITPEGVFVETQAAGRLRIIPKVVRSINMGKSTMALVESNFASGSMEPWVARGGAWTASEAGLTCRNRGSGSSPIYVKVDQKEPITLVAKVQALEGNMRCDLVVFADTSEGSADEGRYGRNSLFAMFMGSEYYLQYTAENRGTSMIVNRPIGRAITQGTLRLAYDPGTGKARLWVDSVDLGQYDVPTKPTSGQFVMFNSYFPVKVEYLTVLRGIVPPSGDDESVDAAADAHTVQFANRDRVSVTSVALADGELAFTTSYGQLKCPVANVGRIVFSKKAQEEPRRQNNDVRVRTAAGRLTFQFEKLTADTLVGKSDYLSDVKVRRSAVREIKFNLYR